MYHSRSTTHLTMDPNTLKLAQLNSFLQRAHTAPLGLTARTPPIPPPTEYAQPWPLYPELCSPEVSRALIQVHRFDEIGQSLEVNAHKCKNLPLNNKDHSHDFCSRQFHRRLAVHRLECQRG